MPTPGSRSATRCECRRCAWPSGRPRRQSPAREFPLLLEDEHLIAIDKPAGVAVHGGSGVSFGVIEQLRRARPQARFLELVHRLDKETSGVLLLAKKRSALTALQDQFRARETDKTYAALVVGAWPASKKVIDVRAAQVLTAPMASAACAPCDADDTDGRRSITLVKVAQRFEGYTLLDVTIKTGRTHQIRVHLAHEGHAIVGDDQVRRLRAQPPLRARRGCARRALRAHVPACAAPGVRPPGQRRRA